jgi:hypothetical protein
MKKNFILLFILLFLLFYGLSFAEIPYKEVALRIHRIPYEKHTSNCLIKSNLFCEFLKSKKIEAEVIIGYFKNNKFYRHSWVQYKQDNKCYIIDLTDNPRTWGYESKYYWWLNKGE